MQQHKGILNACMCFHCPTGGQVSNPQYLNGRSTLLVRQKPLEHLAYNNLCYTYRTNSRLWLKEIIVNIEFSKLMKEKVVWVWVCVCTLTQHAKSGHCACSVHAKREFLTMSRHSKSAVGFGFSFGIVILEKPEINPKIMGLAWVRFWHWNYF